MRAGKKRKWTGELKKPIRVTVVRPKGLAVTDPETVAKANSEMERFANEAIRKEVIRKLGLLMDHYSISDKADWFSLAVALATDHVPGFQIEWPLVSIPVDWEGKSVHSEGGPILINNKKGGRLPEWDSVRLERLLAAVEKEKTTHNIRTDKGAIRRLAMRGEWARSATYRGTLDGWVETLEARLQDAKKFRRLVERAENSLISIISGDNSGNKRRV